MRGFVRMDRVRLCFRGCNFSWDDLLTRLLSGDNSHGLSFPTPT